MALFGKDKSKETGESSQSRPVVGRSVHCRICESYQQFSQCWLRVGRMTQCPCCGETFDDPRIPYQRFQPACMACGEFLEQPGFEYGICDGCGSKYELVAGGKPGLLPNKAQRTEMDKLGKVWTKEF